MRTTLPYVISAALAILPLGLYAQNRESISKEMYSLVNTCKLGEYVRWRDTKQGSLLLPGNREQPLAPYYEVVKSVELDNNKEDVLRVMIVKDVEGKESIVLRDRARRPEMLPYFNIVEHMLYDDDLDGEVDGFRSLYLKDGTVVGEFMIVDIPFTPQYVDGLTKIRDAMKEGCL